jgi:hypothetical protein
VATGKPAQDSQERLLNSTSEFFHPLTAFLGGAGPRAQFHKLAHQSDDDYPFFDDPTG